MPISFNRRSFQGSHVPPALLDTAPLGWLGDTSCSESNAAILPLVREWKRRLAVGLGWSGVDGGDVAMDTQAQPTRWHRDTGPGTHSQSLQSPDVALFRSEPHGREAPQEPEWEIREIIKTKGKAKKKNRSRHGEHRPAA
ncbi:hypothetical protein I7I51_08863 [Histoplasma capsulatum]|uniref:Uncharacterized protein n=1 Tax=Ajellomyces capsulatus TaxID=5037 RepID=A0A8A1LZ09_AJECA|nr:hypothetical protein I7I51_08863 [Histoplasma capsulatum]